MENRLLTVKEAQDFLQVSESTIFRLLKDGKLKGLKVGREWRFRQADIDAYVEAQLKEAEQERAKSDEDAA